MEVTIYVEGTGSPVTSSTCWACGKEFTDPKQVAVVDAASPKLVHSQNPCRDALVPLHA